MKVAILILLCMFLTACGGTSDLQPNCDVTSVTSPRAFTTPTSVVIEGDSLSALGSTTTWPTTVQADSPWTTASWFDVAIGSTTTVDMVNRYGSNVSQHKPINSSGVFLINGGTNDIRYGLPNPVRNTYANLQCLWRTGRQDGFTVIAFTIHSSYIDGYDREPERLELNRLIRSDPSLYDALVPMDQIFPDINDATLLYDKVHFTPAGNAKVVTAVEDVLAGLR